MSLDILMRCVITAVCHRYQCDAVLMLSILVSSCIDFFLMLQYRLVPKIVLFLAEIVYGK